MIRTHPRAARPGRAVVLVFVAAAVGLAARAPALSRDDADAFQRKVVEIQRYGAAAQPTPRVTPVSESELNSYLRYVGAAEIPQGVRQPYVTILGDGRVSGSAIVDLDAVRQARRTGAFDPINLLGGQLEVAAAGRLEAAGGRARFELESASVGGVPIPKAVLQELVSYYSRSPEYPSGISLDETFELPARIREIQVRPGQALVVQH